MSYHTERYAFTRADGETLRYVGDDRWENIRNGARGKTQVFPFRAADLRVAADIVERWDADHAPKPPMVRLRVVPSERAKWVRDRDGLYLSYLRGHGDDAVRDDTADFSVSMSIGVADLAAILDLRDNGAWEVSHDGGATWTPHRTEDGR